MRPKATGKVLTRTTLSVQSSVPKSYLHARILPALPSSRKSLMRALQTDSGQSNALKTRKNNCSPRLNACRRRASNWALIFWEATTRRLSKCTTRWQIATGCWQETTRPQWVQHFRVWSLPQKILIKLPRCSRKITPRRLWWKKNSRKVCNLQKRASRG